MTITTIEWHPYPEEKPKRPANCIISVSSSEASFTTSSWWDPEEKQFTSFFDNIITAWAYMPEPYKEKL